MSIVSKISNLIRNAVRAVGAVANKSPWLAPLALLAVFFVL
jgi:hypothetical protein